jgi:hypothetical protein
MQTKRLKQIVVPPGDGKVLSVLGETITCKVTSAETNGAYSVLEGVTPPKGERPAPYPSK